jgi:hypothetical protein
VIGIAVEARNLDVLRRVIRRANEDESKRNRQHEEVAVSQGEELLEYLWRYVWGSTGARPKTRGKPCAHFYWWLKIA